MFLKSMELMGFKSFADRTHIDFSPGISALLGPNGCGKSNIVDAVKWVLGEQSTKNMRAMKMEDVIFNGTVKRKALNVAEVTLTISNETNILDLEAPEIEIKRRLYRNGDSEYFINNAIVRLKELRELFFDTGIGKTAYSILEQGKIDQILSSRPEERRYLFEEAAGITKYKQKGQEAERKLEKTRDNIKQVQNILSEVSKTYFTLKEQSEKTIQYRSVKDKLFKIEVNLQLLKIEKLKSLHSRRDEEHQKRQKNIQEIEHEIKIISEELTDSFKGQNNLKLELTEIQKELYGIELERETIKNRFNSNKEREKEYTSQFSGLDNREKTYIERSTELKSEISNKRDNQDSLKIELLSLETSLEKNIKENFANNKKLTDLLNVIEESKIDIQRQNLEKEAIIEKIKNIATKIADNLEESLKDFSLDKHNTLIDMFKKQLKLARTNPSILFKLEEDFNDIIKSFPTSVLKLNSGDTELDKKKDYDKQLKLLNKNIDKLRLVEDKSNEDIKIINHKIDIINDLISADKIKIAETKVKISAIEENLLLIDKNLKEEESQLNEIKKERTIIGEKIKQIKLDRTTIEKNSEEILKKEQNAKLNITRIETEISKLKNANYTKENNLNKKREVFSSLTLQIERYNFESEHLESKVSELFEEFQEKYSIELEEVSKNLEDYIDDEIKLKEILQELRIEQKMIGQINLMAPEEFKDVSKRYNFLKDQIDDLKKADSDLTIITNQIKSESTKLFIETFENIKKSFSVMYQRLFGGGSAELELTDQNNILECGIEIYARPPGKSLENISLLSGGERSLTAVALLFATYSIKPSPFCILDEIDAALDERNISRFVSTLTEFSKESQFIVITHNKKTVTGSGSLLGVTMQESGVSKLITMRLEHEEEK